MVDTLDGIQIEGTLRVVPRRIYHIANTIGDELAMTVCRELEGVTLNLPYRDQYKGDMDACHGLPRIIGADKFAALIQVNEGRTFTIPGTDQGLIYEYHGELPEIDFDDDQKNWSGIMRVISRRIGKKKTIILSKTLGRNERVLVPKLPSPSHQIVRSIGALASAILAREYGGQYLNISTICLGAAKKNLILDLNILGLSRVEIAHQAGVTVRYVRRVLNGR